MKSDVQRQQELRDRRKVESMDLEDNLFRKIEVFTKRGEDGIKRIVIDWNLTAIDSAAVDIMAKRQGLTSDAFLEKLGRRVINKRFNIQVGSTRGH